MSEQNQIIEYSVKSIAVVGNTKNIKDFMFTISFNLWNSDNRDNNNEDLEREHYERMNLVEVWQSKLTPKQQKLLLGIFKNKLTGEEDKFIIKTDMKTLINMSAQIKKKLTNDEWDDTVDFMSLLGYLREGLKTRQ